MLASTIFILAGLVSLSTAGYVLEDDYSPSSFFSMFDFFTDADPTSGYVQYVSQSTAQNDGLINNTNGAVYMGVDYTNVASGSGRTSVRITSKKSYNHGLIILDLAHMPGGICGTWPAFWTVGPSWPDNGEIDILEGVNSQAANAMTLHTGSGCSVTNNGDFTGNMVTSNCDINAANQATNAGCSIDATSGATFGTAFNSNGGGIVATEWTSDHISIWFFSHGSTPSDLGGANPNPANWGKAAAAFSGGCDIDNFFKNQQIVFDTTFCGQWAGNVWSTDSVCSSKASTCESYVQNNPSDFKDAYWSVNSLKVYQSNGEAAGSSTPSVSPSSSSIQISSVVSSAISSSSQVAITSSFPALISISTTSTKSEVTVGSSSFYRTSFVTSQSSSNPAVSSVPVPVASSSVAAQSSSPQESSSKVVAPSSPPEFSSTMAVTLSSTTKPAPTNAGPTSLATTRRHRTNRALPTHTAPANEERQERHEKHIRHLARHHMKAARHEFEGAVVL